MLAPGGRCALVRGLVGTGPSLPESRVLGFGVWGLGLRV